MSVWKRQQLANKYKEEYIKREKMIREELKTLEDEIKNHEENLSKIVDDAVVKVRDVGA